jgi:hypothetical protein
VEEARSFELKCLNSIGRSADIPSVNQSLKQALGLVMISIVFASSSGGQVTSPENLIKNPIPTVYVKSYEIFYGKNCTPSMNLPGLDQDGKLISCPLPEAHSTQEAKAQAKNIAQGSYENFEDSFFEGLRQKHLAE